MRDTTRYLTKIIMFLTSNCAKTIELKFSADTDAKAHEIVKKTVKREQKRFTKEFSELARDFGIKVEIEIYKKIH